MERKDHQQLLDQGRIRGLVEGAVVDTAHSTVSSPHIDVSKQADALSEDRLITFQVPKTLLV